MLGNRKLWHETKKKKKEDEKIIIIIKYKVSDVQR